MEKPLVVYFSCTDTTAKKAKLLAQLLKTKALRLTAKVPYTSADLTWQNATSRANREQEDPACRPEFEPLELPEFETLFLGYPTWWGIPPRLIETFLESLELTNKHVVLFTTSGSSAPEKGRSELKRLFPQVTFGPVKRVNNATEAELNAWLTTLNAAD